MANTNKTGDPPNCMMCPYINHESYFPPNYHQEIAEIIELLTEIAKQLNVIITIKDINKKTLTI